MLFTDFGLEASPVVDAWSRMAPQDLGPFVLPEWARVWRKHFGDRSELVVAVASDGSEDAPWGVWALELFGDGRLEQLGGREVTDYSAPAVGRGRMEQFATWLADHLASGALAWRSAHLEAIPADIGFHEPFADELSAKELKVSMSFDEVCPVVDLPDTFGDYLRSLGGKYRHELRRKLKKFATEAGPPVVETATWDSLEADLDQFFTWHRNARGAKGGFLDSGYEGFFRDVARTGMEQGWLRLTFLTTNSRRYSSCFGFELGNTYFLYNSAHDPDARELSPGIVHVACLIEGGIERDIRRFDFLQGAERYKMELGARSRRLVTIDTARL